MGLFIEMTQDGIPKTTPKSARAIRRFTAKETCRFALEYVSITENTMTATDGRLLLKIDAELTAKPGLYRVSTDGWFIGPSPVELNFPGTGYLLFKATSRNTIWSSSFFDISCASQMLYAINKKADACVNIDMLMDIARTLVDLSARNVSVHRQGTKGERPIMIKGEFHGSRNSVHKTYPFQTLQMPMLKD